MLTDVDVRNAKAGEAAYKLADSGGLHLHVSTSGHRSWRCKYRFGGKEKLLTLGSYPQMSLKQARAGRDDAKRLLREGRDPSLERQKLQHRQQASAVTTFEGVARDWHGIMKGQWAKVHAYDVIHSLERDIFPSIGSYPIREIDAAIVLNVLRKIEGRGAIETAHRIRQRMACVFTHGIASGLCEANPAAIVGKAMKPMPKTKPQPAVVELADARAMITAVDEAGASPVTRLAHRLLALTGVRISNVTNAEWMEFEQLDGANPIWRIPAAKMKGPKAKKDDPAHEHVVPLAPAAVDVVEAIRPLTGRSRFVFPNQRHVHKPMSKNAIGYLLNRCGYQGRHVPHGWRAAFSTIMNERAMEQKNYGDREVIDAMLAHITKGAVEGAYNRAEHMKRRRELAEEWATLVMKDRVSAASLLFTPRR